MIMNIIETPRLILRQWESQDIEEVIKLNQDPLVMEYFPKTLNKEETIAQIDRFSNHIKTHKFGPFACILKETGKCIGWIGLMIPPFDAHFTPCVEIGWRLASSYWGNGYATEGAQAILNKAFIDWNLKEVVSFTPRDNKRSRRVMERLGMHYNPQDDFQCPNLPLDHPLSWRVLYRINKRNK